MRMKNRLPIISDKQKICIICEGNEDYAYLDKLNSLNVWNDQYEFFLDNAGGNGNIPAKQVNAPLIEKYTGIKNYKARADQINAIMEYITAENYREMRRRVDVLATTDTITGSSNFGKFMKLFESKDSGWIDEINTELEKESM